MWGRCIGGSLSPGSLPGGLFVTSTFSYLVLRGTSSSSFQASVFFYTEVLGFHIVKRPSSFNFNGAVRVLML